MYSVLTQKYSWSTREARAFADFLTPMLQYDTKQRATAWQSLNHPWVLNDYKHLDNGPIEQTLRRANSSSVSSSSESSSNKCDKSKNMSINMNSDLSEDDLTLKNPPEIKTEQKPKVVDTKKSPKAASVSNRPVNKRLEGRVADKQLKESIKINANNSKLRKKK
jgi:hypothetical protein